MKKKTPSVVSLGCFAAENKAYDKLVWISATNLPYPPDETPLSIRTLENTQNLFDSICISGMTCQEYGKKLVRQNMLGGGIGADGQGGGGGLESLLLLDSSGDGNIK